METVEQNTTNIKVNFAGHHHCRLLLHTSATAELLLCAGTDIKCNVPKYNNARAVCRWWWPGENERIFTLQ